MSHFVLRPDVFPHCRPKGGYAIVPPPSDTRLSLRTPPTVLSRHRISWAVEPLKSSDVMNWVVGAAPTEIAGTIVNACEPSGSFVWVRLKTLIGTTGTEQS